MRPRTWYNRQKRKVCVDQK